MKISVLITNFTKRNINTGKKTAPTTQIQGLLETQVTNSSNLKKPTS
ncbi:hypothetical protein QN326_03110 [Candidatus Phytoplasma asteris]|uniref:Uncharacterized protein n=1 Tax=Candidatus Phytoplasma asteris TaxID=85620 RepID=A0ABZ3CDC9_9MOLU